MATTLARQVASVLIPSPVREFIKCRIDPDYRDAKWRERGRKISAEMFRLTDGKVAAGPFKGMSYRASFADNGILGFKLAGTYEKEIAAAAEQIIAARPSTVINMGAGEGYYAVGMALRLPDARVIAYELEPSHQAMIRELASVNHVADRIDIRGGVTAPLLAETLAACGPDTAIICDIEGYEHEVLDPAAIPQLKGLDILVELHDVYRPGVSRELKRRFEPTHTVQLLHTVKRNPEDFPAGVNLDPALRLACMDEDRGHTMYFYWMRPKH